MKVCPNCLRKHADAVGRCPEDGAALLPLEGNDPALGEALEGRFILTGLLGRGAMGAVYKAYQRSMRRFVAVKVLLPHIAGSKQHVQRFIREATAAAQLRSPHTVTLYDFGETGDGSLFIAMEMLSGKELGHVLEERGRLSVIEALEVVAQACLSLEEAHARGIVHRDLKPANMMIEERPDGPLFVKVVDFGIAKVLGEGASLVTQEGATCGTPSYMSPEQVMGEPLDARTDIYSLGLILFELVTGQRPFREASAAAILIRHLNDPVPMVRSLCPELELPPELDEIIQRCVAKKAEGWFRSCRELREECQSVKATLVAGLDGVGAGAVGRRPGTEDQFGISHCETLVDTASETVPEPRGERKEATTVAGADDTDDETGTSGRSTAPASGETRKRAAAGRWLAVASVVAGILLAAVITLALLVKHGAESKQEEADNRLPIAAQDQRASRVPGSPEREPAGAGTVSDVHEAMLPAPPAPGSSPPEERKSVAAPAAPATGESDAVRRDLVEVTGDGIGSTGDDAEVPGGAAAVTVAVVDTSGAVIQPNEIAAADADVQTGRRSPPGTDKAEGKGEGKEKGKAEGGGTAAVNKGSGSDGKGAVKKSAGSVSLTGVNVTGSLSQDEAEKALGHLSGSLRGCSGKAEWPEAGLKITLMVQSDGRVSSRKVQPAVGAAAGCVSDALRDLAFPAFGGSFSIVRFSLVRK